MQITAVVVVLDENCNVHECINCDEEHIRNAIEMCKKEKGYVR